MYTPDMKEIMRTYANAVMDRLNETLPSARDGQNNVVRAMQYSLSNGGKRLRPILVFEFCRMCGGNVETALDYACAVECIHTYSLIHDDLPCMDNDDLRRGKPSCHKMFGEATALLAGDALLTHAFSLITDSDCTDEQNGRAISLLAQNAGVAGMIGGQVLDMRYEESTPSVSELLTVHRLKTGALISAACILGCIAGGGTEEQIVAASSFAYYLGIAFQIKDDLLDVYGDQEKLGKPVGSDKENDKTTYVTLVGKDKAEKDVVSLTDSAIEQLSAFGDTEFMEKLCRYLINREN